MKSFKELREEENWILPDYPEQILSKDDPEGNWVTGDSPKGIEFPLDGEVRGVDNVANILKKASNTIKKERESSKRKKQPSVEGEPKMENKIYEAIQSVVAVDEKLTPAQIASREKHRVGGRQGRGMSGPGSHQTKGTVGDLEKKRHGKQLAKQGAAGKDSNIDPTTKRTQDDLKKKLLAKKRDALSKERQKLDASYDPEIVEAIFNRVMDILDEKIAFGKTGGWLDKFDQKLDTKIQKQIKDLKMNTKMDPKVEGAR